MTVHASGTGLRRGVRFALALLLCASLLAVAPAAGATTTPPACPPTEPSHVEVATAMQELLAFAQEHKDGTSLPSQEEIDAQLAKLFGLVDYFLAYANTLDDEQVNVLLAQVAGALEAQGLPADQSAAVQERFAALLAGDQPVTPEQVINAVVDAVTPVLLEAGYTEEQVALLKVYLLQFVTKPACPDDGATPAPTTPPPSPTETTTAQPVDNAPDTSSEQPSESSDDDDDDREAAPATGGGTATGTLANTGIDTLLLLGLVAVAMIAGGTALSAGRPRPVRGRHQQRRR